MLSPGLVEAVEACNLLDIGISLTEQGRADETGEVPLLLIDWMKAVRPVIEEVRAKKQAEAQAKARREANRQR